MIIKFLNCGNLYYLWVNRKPRHNSGHTSRHVHHAHFLTPASQRTSTRSNMDVKIRTTLKKQCPRVSTIPTIEDAWRIDCAAYGPDNVNPYWRQAYGYPGGVGSIHVHNNTVIRVTKSAHFTFDYEVVVTPVQYKWALAHRHLPHAEFNERFFEAFPGPCNFETKRQIDRICGHIGYDYNGSAFTGKVGELCFRPARAASEDYDEIPAAFYRITARGLLTCSVDEVPADSP